MLKTKNKKKKEVVESEEEEIEEEEIWKPIPIKSIKEKYEISNLGRIRNITNGNILKLNIRSGYRSFTYKTNGISKSVKIHRLVAKSFVKNKNSEVNNVVNHLNGDKLDSRASNLEWTTYSGNAQHAADNDIVSKTERAVIQFDLETGKKIKQYKSILSACKATGASDGEICNVCSGKRSSAKGFGWKYVKENPNHQLDIDLSEYKQIMDFPRYVINNEGKIYNWTKNMFMKIRINSEGCNTVTLVEGTKQSEFLIHRLVAAYFLKKKDPTHNSIHHIDGDKTNNNVENLRWKKVGGVVMLDSKYKTPYFNRKTAIKPAERKSIGSGPKDLLTSNPKYLSKPQRERRKELLINSDPKKLSPKLQEERKRLIVANTNGISKLNSKKQNSGSKTTKITKDESVKKPKKNSGSKTSKKSKPTKKPTKKINNEEIVEV